ncbi:hypothetical protein IJ384_02390 [bacterium]|nr:hypothetical protein [bacterium]
MVRDFFLKCAAAIVKNENVIDVYKQLKDFYFYKGVERGYAVCLEKLWHLERKPEQLIELSEISLNNLKEPKLSCMFRAMYFFDYSQEEFLKFLKSISIDQELIDNILYEYKSTEFILMIHRALVCMTMMSYAKDCEDFVLVLDLSKYLDQIENQINEFIYINNIPECRETEAHFKNKMGLSSILSRVENHNDINKLAIKLNPNNEIAYINILDDLLIYGNYEVAKSFYNNEICPRFNKEKTDSLEEICWRLSSKYSADLKFYKALTFQKLALEFNLRKTNCEV